MIEICSFLCIGLQLYFSCGGQRDRFYQLCKNFLRSAEDFVDLDEEEKSIEYDYEMDKNGQRVLLGSGTFGRVLCRQGLQYTGPFGCEGNPRQQRRRRTTAARRNQVAL